LLREALVRLFSKRADLLVVGQSGYSEESTLNVLKSGCDVLLIDSLQIPLLPRANSPENPDPASFKVVVIARDSDEKQFLAAVRSGVTGYLLQDAPCVLPSYARPYFDSLRKRLSLR
jgi:DNA-binding NarL/FixJ family response regulator